MDSTNLWIAAGGLTVTALSVFVTWLSSRGNFRKASAEGTGILVQTALSLVEPLTKERDEAVVKADKAEAERDEALAQLETCQEALLRLNGGCTSAGQKKVDED